jgi:selenocysteine lyase/cysteine desulfurase
MLKSVEAAGIEGLLLKRNPTVIQPKDFFEPAQTVKTKFAQMVNGAASQVAIIPSVSYGMQTVANNLPTNKGNHVLLVSDEFPSAYYPLQQWCSTHHKTLTTIKAPTSTQNRGKAWNEELLAAIHQDTVAVFLSAVHWIDGTWFDLPRIGQRCKEVGALLVVDGTQSVGAMHIDIKAYQIDALICGAYKWLLAPYSIGLAYFSEVFNEGTPIEASWMNRSNAKDFSQLTNYVDTYSEGAGRYNVGEYSNFILLPMLNAALTQLLAWGTAPIQAYGEALSQPLTDYLQNNGYWVEAPDQRAKHLFGFKLRPDQDLAKVVAKLQERKIFVSVRGTTIRVAVHLYNTPEDIAALLGVLKGE